MFKYIVSSSETYSRCFENAGQPDPDQKVSHSNPKPETNKSTK